MVDNHAAAKIGNEYIYCDIPASPSCWVSLSYVPVPRQCPSSLRVPAMLALMAKAPRELNVGGVCVHRLLLWVLFLGNTYLTKK